MLPIEHPSNNPYKLLQDNTVDQSLFQKHSSCEEETNWSGTYNTPSIMAPSFPYNAEKFEKKEEEFLTHLLDIGDFNMDDFSNNMMTPSNDPFIPIESNSPNPQNNTFLHDPNYLSPQTSPMQLTLPAAPQQSYYEKDISMSLLKGLKVEEYDPLVSGVNEYYSPPPNNEIFEPSNEIISQQPNDDLKDLLGELLGPQEDLLLTNSLGQSPHNSPPSDINLIPSSLYTTMTPLIEEETNQDPMCVDEDTIIPSSTYDLPPATKKSRGLDIDQPIEDISKAIKVSPTSPDEPKRKPIVTAHSPPVGAGTPTMVSALLPMKKSSSKSRSNSASSSSSSNGGTMLFGQHEHEIIEKLTASQNSSISKPITRDKLVVMAVEEFNALLNDANLTEIEVAFMKEWRRRGKNKMAAQIARKRKREELSELEEDMGSLRQKRAQLQQSARNLEVLIASFKRRAEAAEKRIYEHYSTAHGSLVSRETHTIHVTDDGKTILIPRISSQILLV